MSPTPLYAGLDIGSVFTKAMVTAEKKPVASSIVNSGGNFHAASESALKEVLGKAQTRLEDLSGLVVTGVGAESASITAWRVSDISCQAMGCFCLFPGARTIIDIGGQYTRAFKITPSGRVADFLMSEKCAAGSGRFLQIIARILRIGVEEIGPLSLKAQNPVEFSTSCAVFAESETVSRIAEGASKEDILAGVHRAMAAKAAGLVKRLRLEADVVLTGGGAEDIGLIQAVGQALKIKVLVPETPRLTCAYGAACLAAEGK